MRALWLILLLLSAECSAVAGAKDDGVMINGRSYACITFKPGLPSFKPLNDWRVTNPRFADIPIGETFGRVCVCIGRDSTGVERVIVLNFKTDGAVSMKKGVQLKAAGNDTLHGQTEFQLLPSQSSLFPLDFVIVTSRDEFIYRWSQSVDDGSTPGGFPTPISSAIEVGKAFPKVKVRPINGGRRDLVVADGRICVVNWWWTRCSACIQEMPGLNTLVKKYKGRVSFVAVNSDPIDEVRAFLAKRTFIYQQTVTDTSSFEIFGRTAPRNVVLNKAGIVVFDDTGGGSETYKKIEAVVQRELNR
jgi:thiol-disulfide isomerase/thioredoxin